MRHAIIAALLTLALFASPTARAQTGAQLSPTIQALTANPSTEDALWRRLSQGGGPIVEPSSDTNSRLVTFVWRGEAEQVGVITPLSLIDIDRGRMERVANTNTWFRTYELPTNTIFAYRFAPNDSFVPFDREPNFFQRLQSWLPDPINRERFNFGAGPDASVLSLSPGDARWRERRGVRRGSVVTENIHSARLSGNRSVQIYTPPGFRAGASDLPLLILLDGTSYISLISAPTQIDNLIADGDLPPLVVAFVDAGEDRDSDFRCNENWSGFLAEELTPMLRDRFHAGGNAARTIVGGYSLGGLAAACAAVAHPGVFGNVFAQSGSFYSAPQGEPPELLARTLAQQPQAPLNWYIEIGQLETAAFPSRDPSMLTSSRHLRDVLTAKGYPVRYREYYGGHEQLAWRTSFAAALSGFFANPEP